MPSLVHYHFFILILTYIVDIYRAARGEILTDDESNGVVDRLTKMAIFLQNSNSIDKERSPAAEYLMQVRRNIGSSTLLNTF